MSAPRRELLSGDEAVALAALDGGITLGTGYPGTPSTEILEYLSSIGGRAQWAPNEKVALEVAIGVSFAGARALMTTKHVGLNVAADPLFTAAYTGVQGALVIVVADDPGMASSQNEQDSRHYAEAAALPMIEPSDSQESYDFMLAAIELSERWNIPVLLRLTTRVCHSKTIVQSRGALPAPPPAHFERDIKTRVMIPAYARPAHRRLRTKLDEIAEWAETSPLNMQVPRTGAADAPAIITSGVSFGHVLEAAPGAPVLKLGVTYPLPLGLVRDFVKREGDAIVVEEGDPILEKRLLADGIAVRGKPSMYRFGEFNVNRVRRILAGDTSPEPPPAPGKPPELCKMCPYRPVYNLLSRLGCIVAGDIGCYTLGVLPPFSAMDTCVCMGASLGVGLGLRHALPEEQARKVVSIIGDSTFMHSGLTGVAEMVYNLPPTGHVLIILDNSTTAMTGQQEHPGTGRTLAHEEAGKVVVEEVLRGMGVTQVHVNDPVTDPDGFESILEKCLASNEACVIIERRVCILAAGRIKEYERAAQKCSDPLPATENETAGEPEHVA
ncbi:thiamine pyrophosphate-binding protein [candidate division BRC1 bacterium HGW-BRC1-1]|jgi:indolepyruvate ferredoxin oxidoreductase alpha subunit|nr:MAG: thiamine pyrophosphate-binding protein [candidate division BRC1 bacterium HGW-BRC1-1]